MIDNRLLESSLRAFHENDPLQCEQACRRILSEQINHPLGGHLLAWSKMERRQPVTEIIERLRICPETKKAKGIPARATLGWLLWNSGRTKEAIVELTENLKREPDRRDLHTLLGICLLSDHQYQPAAGILRAVVSQSPKNPVPRFHLAHALLHLDDWESGFAELEKCRFDLPVHQAGPYDSHPELLWQGQDLTGKVIVIEGEQGFGDQIQFVRYAQCLKAEFGAAEVHFTCHPALTDLMQTADHLDSASAQIMAGFDYFVPAMSLPHRCRARVDGNLYTSPYLRSGNKKASNSGKPRIGICWRSAPMGKSADRSVEGVNFIKNQKSLKTPDLAFLLENLAGKAELVSLQVDATPEEKSLLKKADVSCPRIENFTETASLITSCDRIITIDTAVVHLAGALGAETHLLLSRGSDWRWTHEKGGRSIWYPSIALHRQQTAHSWNEPVLSAIDAALENF